MNTENTTEDVQPEDIEPAKSRILAALLSFCFLGGAGQIYLGQRRKGITIIIIALAFSLTGLEFVIMILGTIDAYLLGKKVEAGEPIGERQWCWQPSPVTAEATEEDKISPADTEADEQQEEPPATDVEAEEDETSPAEAEADEEEESPITELKPLVLKRIEPS